MEKKMIYHCLIIAAFLFIGKYAMAQQTTKVDKVTPKSTTTLKTYVIEREIPEAGKLTSEELRGISQKSCSVLEEMGPSIQWQHSYVTGNKIYCVYKAENEELLKQHAEKGGFPANSIVEVSTIISPATAN